MSLYRKYRPTDFAHLVGQEHVRTTLLNALKTKNVHHAYLFTGPRGTGKTSTARLLAKAINCQNPQDEACNSCEICVDMAAGRLIDLIEIDAASNRGIDEIRDLKEKIQFAPTRAKNKIYIIDEVHMLTKEAFNALLKTLEEPPAQVYFILATTEVHKIPETILSRCQRFDFKRIDDATLLSRLKFVAEQEGVKAEEEALSMIVQHVEGGLRDALGLLEQLTQNQTLSIAHVQEVLGISNKGSQHKLYKALQESDIQSALKEIHDFYHEGFDLTQFNKDFLELLRQELLKSVQAGNQTEINRLLELIGYFQESYQNLKHATIIQLPLEIAIIQACFGKKKPENDIESPPFAMQVSPTLHPSASSQPLVSSQKMPDLATLAQVTPPETISKQSQVDSSLQVEASPLTAPSLERGHQPLGSTISFEEIKQRWNTIAMHCKVPSVRRLFANVRPSSLQNNELILAFPNNFTKEKLMETTNRLDLEQALQSTFQVPLKIVALLEPLHMASSEENPPLNARIPQNLENKASHNSGNKSADQLLEVFGGEFL